MEKPPKQTSYKCVEGTARCQGNILVRTLQSLCHLFTYIIHHRCSCERNRFFQEIVITT